MPFKFNPFTGNFDQTGSGGGGSSYIDGEVATYNDLPLDGTAALNSAWLVRTASGVWPVSRKQAGIYIRTATAGSSRDADYTYAGTMPDVFSDAVLTIYDEASTTRTGQFNLGSITAGQNRVLTWPDGNGTIARTSDIPSTFAASAITSGVFDNARINFAAPSAIGSTTAAAITGTTGTFSTLSANNGTLTASAPVLDLSQTWNNAAVTFTGIQFNITNTASVNAASGSKYFEIAVGGVPQIRFQRNFSTPYLYFGNTDTGVGAGSTTLNIICNGGVAAQIGSGSSGISVRSDAPYQWSSTTGFAAADLQLFRDAADTLAQRRTTNPQAFRIYNTTDAGLTNFERGFMRWSSNVLEIGVEQGGTGTNRAIRIGNTSTSGSVSVGTATSWGGSTGFWTNINGGQASMGAFLSNFRVGSFIAEINSSNAAGNASELIISCGLGLARFGGTTSSFPALKRSSTTLQVRLADDSAFAAFECAGLTLNGNLTASTRNIVTDTTTGTRIGTGTTQLLGFWNAAPSAQPAAVADATDAASTQARLNDLLARLRTIGIIAT